MTCEKCGAHGAKCIWRSATSAYECRICGNLTLTREIFGRGRMERALEQDAGCAIRRRTDPRKQRNRNAAPIDRAVA